MKKFLAAVCCVALVSMNVSAQEPQVVGQAAQSIVEAPGQSIIVADSDATLVSSIQDAAAPATPAIPTADAVVEAPAVEPAATEGALELAPAATEGSVIDNSVIDNSVVSQPIEQSFISAPVGADCGCGQAAPVVSTGCGCEPAPAVDYCCDSGKERKKLFSRLRDRRSSRKADCCCN